MLQLADINVLGTCQRFCLTVCTLLVAVLLEPVEAEAAFRIQIPLLTLIVIGDGAVNCHQCFPYRYRLATDRLHPAVAGVNLHPRSDGGLRQIGRGDVPFLC